MADDPTLSTNTTTESFLFQTNRKVNSLDSQIITNNNKLVKNISFQNDKYTDLNFDSNSFCSQQQQQQSAINKSNTNSNHLRPSFKQKSNSFNNSPNQSPAQTPFQNKCVLKAFSDLQQQQQQLQQNDDENELKIKENYCNSWVMSSNNSNDGTSSLADRRSMNSSIKSNASNSTCSSYMQRLQNELTLNETNQLIAARKQTSNLNSPIQQALQTTPTPTSQLFKSHIDKEYLDKAKEEEKLQREYLVNLLKQLESEQEVSSNQLNVIFNILQVN